MAELSPIMTMFREWEATFAEPGKRANLTNKEHSRLINRCSDIEHHMLALPSTTTADFAAKLIASTSYGGYSVDEDGPLMAEAKALVVDCVDHPDAELLKLGEQYRTARQAEIALYREIGDDESPETMERVDKLSFEMGGISNAILALRPKTIDGLRVIASVWGTHHVDMDGNWPSEDACTDTRAVHSVMRWLIGEAQS